MSIEIGTGVEDFAKTYILTSATDWRTDRVNAFLYGPPGCGKTDLAVRFPHPVLLDTGDNGALTVKKMIAEGRLTQDIPVLRTTDFTFCLDIMAGGESRLADVFRGSKWEGYEKVMGTIIIDTISSLEGFCWDEILERNRKSEASAGAQEINALRRRMTALLRAGWNLPYNTVFTAHDDPGRAKSEFMTKKAPGPMLTGKLTKQAPALADFFIYMRKEASSTIGDSSDIYVSYLDKHPEIDEYPARNKLADATGPLAEYIREILPKRIVNLDYSHLREALDKVEELSSKFKEKEQGGEKSE